MSANPILEVTDLRLTFGGVVALDGATFDVLEGSITALVGPNGAGKSTAFNAISGFAEIDSGRVQLKGQEITGLPPHKIVAKGLVRTFQLTKTFGGMTVLDNMLVAGSAQPSERLVSNLFQPRAARLREQELRSKARELLAVLRLESHAGTYAANLSGGQRKLVELARALMAEPDLILLDEPMAGVNPSLGEEIFDYIEVLRAEMGKSFLFVEHDMGVVVRRSDRMIVMAQGAVIADGDPTDVVKDPVVLEAYLGSATSK